MNCVAKVSALLAWVCLDAGLASANGTEPGPDALASLPATVASVPTTPVLQPSHAMMPLPSLPVMAPVAPVWLQVPATGLWSYYVMPQAGGMAWPGASALPAAPVPPARMLVPPGWVPYVLVLVPLRPLAPAQVDYGPVAETPVVPLPGPEALGPSAGTEIGGAGTTEPAGAAAAIAAIPPAAVSVAEPAPPVPATPAPATAPAPAIEGQAPVPMKAVEPVAVDSVQLAVAPKPAAVQADVDYGPVAPTPVVDLLAVAAASASRGAISSTTVRTAKPVAKKPGAARPLAVPSAKQRMCWTNGVVSPCK